MFGIDVVVDQVNATHTTLYVAAAGKHTPANIMGTSNNTFYKSHKYICTNSVCCIAGNGGDAFAWQVIVANN
jgi:hypothetical protein